MRVFGVRCYCLMTMLWYVHQCSRKDAIGDSMISIRTLATQKQPWAHRMPSLSFCYYVQQRCRKKVDLPIAGQLSNCMQNATLATCPSNPKSIPQLSHRVKSAKIPSEMTSDPSTMLPISDIHYQFQPQPDFSSPLLGTFEAVSVLPASGAADAVSFVERASTVAALSVGAVDAGAISLIAWVPAVTVS